MSALECFNSSNETYLLGWKLSHYARMVDPRGGGFVIEMCRAESWYAEWYSIRLALDLYENPQLAEDAFEEAEHLGFVVRNKKLLFMEDGVEAWKARLSFRVDLEYVQSKTLLIESNQAELISETKKALAKEQMPEDLPGWEERIDDMSGSDFTKTKFSKLGQAFKQHLEEKSSGGDCKWLWQIWEFDIIKAVYNLACAHSGSTRLSLSNLFTSVDDQVDDFDNKSPTDIATIWTVFQTILEQPGAIEKEYVRMKTRFASLQNCQKVFPKFMKLYSLCFLLRVVRWKRWRAVNKVPYTTRQLYDK